MLLKSNIKSVIWRLEQFKDGVPGALARAVEPGRWLKRLKASTLATLRKEWSTLEPPALKAWYEAMAPKMVELVVGVVIANGARYEMTLLREGARRTSAEKGEKAAAPAVDLAKAAEYQKAYFTKTGRERKWLPTHLLEPEQLKASEESLNRAREVVRDWVELEKRRREEDMHADGTPYSNDELTDRMLRILGLHPHGEVRERTEEMRDNGR